MERRNGELENDLLSTINYAEKTVSQLDNFNLLNGKLQSLLRLVRQCVLEQKHENTIFSPITSELQLLSGKIVDTCKRYAMAKFPSFCQVAINKELLQHSQDVSHMCNTVFSSTYFRKK